jgi:2'-5' RNA ligase
VETIGRVFAATPLPAEIRLALAASTASMEIPGKTVPPENWHVTLRYLGRVDQIVFERFLHGLSGANDHEAFRIGIDRLGAFPNARRATVVWAGIGAGAERLAALNQIAEGAAVGAGLAPEERPFHPHLTLSRVRPPEDVGALIGGGLRLDWVCDRVVVYESRQERGGVRYDPLETIGLGG